MSKNVFADLGLKEPEELQFKAGLIWEIHDTIQQLGLTQSEAARRAGVTQSSLSQILSGRRLSVTIDRLFAILNNLGRPVQVHVVTVKEASKFEKGLVLV